MSIPLKTQRLILRDFKLNDLESYFQITQCPKYQTFYIEEDCTFLKAEELVSLFVQTAKCLPRKTFQLAVTIKGTEKFIGSAGIRIESGMCASIGCGLDTEYQKSGYASEAMRKLVDFGFKELKLNYIYAKTICKNKAAVSLCEKLGMKINDKKTAKKTIKNQEWNEVLLEIHKKDL